MNARYQKFKLDEEAHRQKRKLEKANTAKLVDDGDNQRQKTQFREGLTVTANKEKNKKTDH